MSPAMTAGLLDAAENYARVQERLGSAGSPWPMAGHSAVER